MSEQAALVLQAEKVTQRFGEVVAIEEFSLQVPRGEFLVIVGPSGCGKSTVLNQFAGFLRPSSGRVLLDGQEIRDVEPRCGMVFQKYALFPWLSVERNISFGPDMRGVAAEKTRARVDQLLQLIDIEPFRKHYPSQLSGGMQQRVALARTLANDPEVLLCDEPFAALDAMTRQVLQAELVKIVAAEAKTVVFITHSIDEALLLADRIVVMSARPGRIKLELQNSLPRPRSVEVQNTEAYAGLKQQIWECVREEVLASMSKT